MNLRTQIIIVVAVIASMAGLAGMVRKRTISLKYALPWAVLGIGVIIFTVFPVMTERLSTLIGVELPVNMIFFLGFCFALLILFSLSMAVSRQSKKMKQLVQHQALLEKRLEAQGKKESFNER